jgi:hypothetical protein
VFINSVIDPNNIRVLLVEGLSSTTKLSMFLRDVVVFDNDTLSVIKVTGTFKLATTSLADMSANFT